MDNSKIDPDLQPVINKLSQTNQTIPILVSIDLYSGLPRKNSRGWIIDPLTKEQIEDNQKIICEVKDAIIEITSLSFDGGEFLFLATANSFSLRCNVSQIEKISELSKVKKIYLNKIRWKLSE